MKKKLYLAHVNLNERNGVGLATRAFYNALKTLYGDNVDLLMPEEGVYGEYSDAIGVPPRTRGEALLSFSPHRYKSFLKKYLKKHKDEYDICIINGGIYAGDMINMIHRHRLRIVVIHHNFDREYHMDNKTSITFNGRTSLFVDYLENKAYKGADVNCFLTNQDKDLFEKNYGFTHKPSFVIHVFEPGTITDEIFDSKRVKKIVICGSMNTLQTISGIIDLRDNYYYIIKKMCPEWELVLAGRKPGQVIYDFRNTNPERITVVPNPIDMNDVTKQASIFLCPTNVGGGLKLRVMDGLRQGLPVLVHEVSARGYDVFYDKPYFKVYNDQTSFNEGLSQLLQLCESGLSKELIRKDYLENFGYEIGCSMMRKVIDALGQ